MNGGDPEKGSRVFLRRNQTATRGCLKKTCAPTFGLLFGFLLASPQKRVQPMALWPGLLCEFESGPQTVTVPFFPLNALFTGSLILGSTQTLRSKSKETKTITTSIAPVQSVEEIRPNCMHPVSKVSGQAHSLSSWTLYTLWEHIFRGKLRICRSGSEQVTSVEHIWIPP